MSQADEDEMRWVMRDDDYDPYDGYDPMADHLLKALKVKPTPKRVTVEGPGSRTMELGDLVEGETFRFPNAVKSTNVYMVIASDCVAVDYVLLNTGKKYTSSPQKRVCQVSVHIVIDDADDRGRV